MADVAYHGLITDGSLFGIGVGVGVGAWRTGGLVFAALYVQQPCLLVVACIQSCLDERVLIF